MKIQIFAMTHKTFDPPSDPLYVSLQVGHATHEDLGYLADDTGDNISARTAIMRTDRSLLGLEKCKRSGLNKGVCQLLRVIFK